MILPHAHRRLSRLVARKYHHPQGRLIAGVVIGAECPALSASPQGEGSPELSSGEPSEPQAPRGQPAYAPQMILSREGEIPCGVPCIMELR